MDVCMCVCMYVYALGPKLTLFYPDGERGGRVPVNFNDNV